MLRNLLNSHQIGSNLVQPGTHFKLHHDIGKLEVF